MKSIRVSLIVYFLLLLAVALGTASILVYRTAAESLRAKQEVNRQLLRNQYDDRRDKVGRAFDEELLTMARDVARSAVTVNQWDRLIYSKLFLLGLTGTEYMHAIAPVWIAEFSASAGPPGSFSSFYAWKLIREIHLDEGELPRTADVADREYFQINSPWVPPWQSRSLGGHHLPFEIDQFASADLFTHRSDDVRLTPDGPTVHRVMLKYPALRGRNQRPPRSVMQMTSSRPLSPRPSPDGSRTQPPPPPSRPPMDGRPLGGPGNRAQSEAWVPWIVVHCAVEPHRRDEALAKLEEQYDQELANQEEAAHETLTTLRHRLLAIGLCMFLATTLGGSLLVGFGLAPLRRLTDAVSRVTPKDFRLPIAADEPLPNELAPIRERLQQTLDELRKAFEREKQAAADISHELRTPVASMLTAVEVALKKPRSPEEYRETLRECRAVARQMRQLVERLLALARIDAGSDRLRPRAVDVGALVTECAALVRPLAGERGLDLRVHCPKPVTWTTDPDKLREVLVNLLHNAIQYNRPAGAVDVSAQADGGWLDVQVHDTGVGIAPEAFEHIFERFYRADASRHADDLHAGLGLSIVKGYVGLLGGTITVESQVGQGSTFRVRLPAAATAA
jgi:signal transduction histidine kinase